MNSFELGDRVRIDIPDEKDPDHRSYHGKHGEIIAVIPDDGDEIIDAEEASKLYRVDLDSGDTFDARAWDLRPPIS